MLNDFKILLSNDEASRMIQANSVTQRLFSLIDIVTKPKFNTLNHESCEMQNKKLLLDLSTAQQQIQQLSEQWNSHICWSSGQSQPEEFKRYTF